MEEYLTIGEVSKITQMPISTLRYYDKEGIVKPYYKDEETNYRYYRLFQIPILKMIVHLKKLGFNNTSIKSHLQNLSYTHTLKLMDKMMEETNREIERLKELQEELKDNAEQVKYLIKLENEVDKFFEEELEINGIYSDISNGNLYEAISRSFKELDSFLLKNAESLVPIGIYGFTIKEENIFKKTFKYDKLIVLKKFENYKNRYIVSKKSYICLICQGNFESVSNNILRVCEWIKKHKKGYKIQGDAIVNIVSGPAFQQNPFEAMYILKVPIEK